MDSIAHQEDTLEVIGFTPTKNLYSQALPSGTTPGSVSDCTMHTFLEAAARCMAFECRSPISVKKVRLCLHPAFFARFSAIMRRDSECHPTAS
mmetsp:Transcript_22089/g.68092  ORF Transcript_22089/g.68092 Transcript_22089/m.68092 type:complete len:93 (+) Transcript_22089:114-392(+)